MEFLSPVILIIRFLCSDIIKNFWSKSWARALQKNLQLKKSPRSPKLWFFFRLCLVILSDMENHIHAL